MNAATLNNVTQTRNGVGWLKGISSRSGDDRNVIIKVHVNGLCEELLRVKVPEEQACRPYRADVFQMRRWLTKTSDEAHTRLPSFLFSSHEVSQAFLLPRGSRADVWRRHADSGEILVHIVGIAGVFGLGMALGTTPYFFYQALEHIPLSAVTNRISQKKSYQAAVKRLIKGVKDVLKEPVGLLHLVPK